MCDLNLALATDPGNNAECTHFIISMLVGLIAAASAHSNLIWPKPRNAIDTFLPEWSGGKAPTTWEDGENPCACINGTGQACDIGQTCLWFSVGCGIGCPECDGLNANPNGKDRCNNGMKPTINNPLHRTYNRAAKAGSDADWTKHNPWRAPGTAPVYDPCGMAAGAPHPTAGHGEYTTTKFAQVGDRGSALPKMPSGVVWRAGDVVETAWSIRANHGGGWQYRLCPAASNLTEACFQSTPIPFAANSDLLLANGTRFTLSDAQSTFVSDGTLPVGSTWQMNPLPNTRDFPGGHFPGLNGYQFPPPCHETALPVGLGHGICSGEWITNITLYDRLRVPSHLPAGEYVLGYRMDCEASAQVWSSCADITITG